MSVKDTIAAMRGEPRAAGIKLGMSKLNDALAKALYGRPYSPCIAAEAAGKPPQPSWDQARCAQVALSYGIHAGSLTAVVLATVTRLRLVQTLIEDPPELPLNSGRLMAEVFPLGAPPQEGVTIMTIDPADEGRAQELLEAVQELPLPTIQSAGTDPRPHLMNAVVAHANREGLVLDGMPDESDFNRLVGGISDAVKQAIGPSAEITPDEEGVFKVLSAVVESFASGVDIVCDEDADSTRISFRMQSGYSRDSGISMTHKDGVSFLRALADASRSGSSGRDLAARLGVHAVSVSRSSTVSGSVVAVRLLPLPEDDLGFDTLGLLDAQIADLSAIVANRQGLCLVAGPSGSGHARMLQVLVAEAAGRVGKRGVAMTIEESVQHKIPNAVQKRVVPGKQGGGHGVSDRDFADAIGEAMRVEPEIIMVSEVKGALSAGQCMDASQSGKMVYAYVNATGAFEAVDRFASAAFGVARDAVCDPRVIKGLIAVRRVKRLCPDCSRLIGDSLRQVDGGLIERVSRALTIEAFWKVRVRGAAPECSTCRGSGVAGTQTLLDVVRIDSSLREVLRTEGGAAAREHWAMSCGGNSMRAHALELVAQGHVDPQDAEDAVGFLDA